METYLGLDLGGTKLLIGEMDRSGNILKYKKYASGFFNQQAAVQMLKAAMDDYRANVGWHDPKHPPLAMGVGLIGRVEPEAGIWHQIDPRRTHPIALAQELQDTYGMTCHIDNDVKSATRAERVWGFGQITKNFVYVNVGTGIAAGIVVNGRQIRGSHFNAGEVGHVRAAISVGVKCCCGRTDCVEAIASGLGLDQCARLLKDRYETALHIPAEKDGRVMTEEVFDLCRRGDPLCCQLVDNAAQALADLIMNLVRTSDPDTVVLGGGVVADGFLHEKVMQRLNDTTMRFVTNGVVITKLNPGFIGLLGAGAVAMNM